MLPVAARIRGVGGASTLVCTGVEQGLSSERAKIVDLDGLVIDGGDRPLAEYVPALVHIAECANVSITNCLITGSAKIGLALDRCGGRIERTTVTHAREAGIRAIESTGLAITDNTVTDCGNGGILVWRWSEGEDGTIVTGNRVERIGATAGGTGENGNGINVFRAHGVMVANNRIADCAFSAVRANAASNVQIIGNNCRDCGEVGIYAEFGFAGALIANNIVDRAATGISVANFNEGGRLAVVANNIIRDLIGNRPLPGRGAGFWRRHRGRGGRGGLRQRHRRRPALRPGARLGAVSPRRRGDRQRHPRRPSRHRRVGGGRLGRGGDQRQSDRRRRLGRHPRHALDRQASGDLARTGAETFPHLMIERNRVG